MKSDRRGVASWGLNEVLVGSIVPRMQERDVPLIDMEVGGHVRGQTRRWRRALNWLQGKIIGI